MSQQIELFKPDFKEISLQSGMKDGIITIQADDWSIVYAKDTKTGTILKDTSGLPLKLNGAGETTIKDGWLTLAKTPDHELKINLLENFSTVPRDFTIGVKSAGGQVEEMHFIQTRGAGYALVKSDIEEIDNSRKIYLSTEGCSTISLVNNTDKEWQMSTAGVFANVAYSSTFTSDDYGAFDWLVGKDSLIFMNDLLVDGAIRWSDRVAYKEGTTLLPFNQKNGVEDGITVRPNSSLNVSGEITYAERTCKYTFTIKNKSSGSQFEIKGIWKQKIPITPHITIK